MTDRGLPRRFPDPLLAALVGLLALVIAGAAWPVRADDALRSDDDLPGRVGRIANVQGPLYRATDDNAGEWSEIGLNYPVAQGDSLWVDRDGRAEIDYGGGQFRLAGDTNVHVSRLDERQLALFVASGRVIVRIRVLDADDAVRVDTPPTQVALTRPGLYRIDVDADAGQATVVVREGEAEVTTATGPVQVLPGYAADLSGSDNVTADIRSGGGVDGFDTWSATRDRVYGRPRQNAYVSRQMVGQADLDAYGAWQTYPDYGAVWFPTVAVDWAPYRFGHWTWLPGWGYTWVDDAPWGYAPFHYGRWAYIGGRWGWCPGAFVARPIWAPALVAWYGGGGWSYSASFGGPVYGWVPLGWREPFVPWWRGCTSRCYARYNRPYAVNVAERRDALPTHFANWSVPGNALASGKPVAANRVPIASNTAFASSLLAAPPAIKPAPPRPGVRPGNGVPQPASAHAARVPAAPASSSARTATLPTAPSSKTVPPAGYPGSGSARLDDRRQPPLPADARRPDARVPNAGTAISRPVPTLRERPAPAERPAATTPAPAPLRPAQAPTPVPAPSAAARALAVPQAVAPAPRGAPAPMPAPQAVVPAPAVPRVAPAPMPAPQAVAPPQVVPRVAPAPMPAPQAVAPPSADRGPVRAAPANPKPAERAN